MTKRLGEIADISVGLPVYRKKSKNPTVEGEKYPMFSLQSLSDGGGINKASLDTFESVKKLNEKYFSKTGDIIMRQTAPFTAVYITEELKDILIPDYFFIIKVKEPQALLPEFLSLYLNSEKMRRIFVRLSTGVAVTKLFVKNLEAIKIPLFDMQKQRTIIPLNNLLVEREQLLEAFIENNRKLQKGINQKILNANI